MNDKSLDETLLIFSFLMQEMHRHPSLSPHSAGWWLGNLLTEGGSIPIVPGYVLPHFSLLIRHFPVTSSQNPNFFEMRTTSPVKQYDTAVLPLNLIKCGSALLFMGKHQVVQEETHVSLLVFQESLFVLQCPPPPLFAQQTAGHWEERIRIQREQTAPWPARKGIHSQDGRWQRQRSALFFF